MSTPLANSGFDSAKSFHLSPRVWSSNSSITTKWMSVCSTRGNREDDAASDTTYSVQYATRSAYVVGLQMPNKA